MIPYREYNMPRYRVALTKEERQELERCRKGVQPARRVLIATALLMMDQGEFAEERWSVDETSRALHVSDRTVSFWKKRLVEEGLDSALERKARAEPARTVQFDGDFEARLVALACTEPPSGRSRWTIRLLAEKVVELKIADSVSTMTVQRALKKTNFSLTGQRTGRSRPSAAPTT